MMFTSSALTDQVTMSYAEVRPLFGPGEVASAPPPVEHVLRAPRTTDGPVPRLRPAQNVQEALPSIIAWQRWLDGLPEQTGAVPARAVRRLWSDLLAKAGVALMPPAAGPGGELGFHLAWHSEEVYIDIDLAPDGTFEWFWVDRRAGVHAGSDDERLRDPPEALVARLVRDFHLR